MSMKTTILLALVALVVAGYAGIDWLRSQNPPVEKPPTTLAKAVFEPKPESKDIDKVELTCRSGKYTFKKQDGTWNIVEPLQSPAAEFEVNGLVDRVADAKYLKAYDTSNKDRPKDSVAGFDKPTATVKLFKGENAVAELVVGDRLPTGKGSYIRKGGSDDILESQTDLSSGFDKRLESFRDKRVLKFELKDVKRVKVEGLQNFELVQNKEEWVVESPQRGRADKPAAEKVARPLSTLYAQDFKDDKPDSLKPYGLHQPRLKITVETSREIPPKAKPGDPNTQPADTQPTTENKTYALLIGGATDNTGTSFFAKLESAPWVFSLADSTVKEFSPTPSDLRDKQLAKIDNTASVVKLETVTPEGAMTLTKSDKGVWAFADGTPADPAAADDLVKAVSTLRAARFENPSDPLLTYDWSKPRAKVTLTRKGDLNPITLLVGQGSASGKMVYVRNAAEDAVASVRESEVDPLIAAPVSYRDRTVLRFPREHANKLEITRAAGQNVVLTKQGTAWQMTQPIKGLADPDAARNLVADISSLRAKRVVAVGDKAKYGLDKPTVTLAVWTQAAPAPPPRPPTTHPAITTRPAVTSRPAVTTRPALNRPGRPPITIKPRIKGAAQGPTTAPAAARPVRSLDDQIKQIESLLEYQRTHKDKENPKATQMLRDKLAELQAQKQATQPSIPVATPVVNAPAGTQPALGASTRPALAAASQPAAPPPVVHRLLLTQKNGITYAACDDQPIVYELDKKVYDDAVAEMLERQILKFDVANVTDVAFEHGDVSIQLRKAGSDWKYVADPAVAIDNQKVTDVLNAFRDFKTHRYVAYAAENVAEFHLDKDVDRAAFTLNGSEKLEVLLSKTGPEGDADKSRFALVAGSKRVFLLKGDQATKFGQKLEDFEKVAGKTAEAPPAAQPAGAME